jgi:hypothetical protein
MKMLELVEVIPHGWKGKKKAGKRKLNAFKKMDSACRWSPS